MVPHGSRGRQPWGLRGLGEQRRPAWSLMDLPVRQPCMRCAGSVNRQLLVSWERPRVAWSLVDLGPDQITHDENACDNARIVLGQTTTPQLRLFLMRRCEGLSGPTKHILCLRSRGDPPTNVAASWLACAHQAPRRIIATGGRCQLLVKLPTAVGQIKPNKAAPPPIPPA